MDRQKIKIAGIMWFHYCRENPSRWGRLVGFEVEDSDMGRGTVVSVRSRENGNPIVTINFGPMTDFTGDSFVEPEVSVWVEVNDANHITRSYQESQNKIAQEQQETEARRIAKRLRDEKTVKEFLRGFSLWHMTHISNIASIMQAGLLSHDRAHNADIKYHDISAQSVQNRRERLDGVYGRRIHEYVPLYINPRNAMLSALRGIQHEICFIEIDQSVVLCKNCVVTDGNAAASATDDYPPLEGLSKLDWQLLRRGTWNNENEAKKQEDKRKMCAEVLVPDEITPKAFLSIRCYNDSNLQYLKAKSIRAFLSRELYF